MIESATDIFLEVLSSAFFVGAYLINSPYAILSMGIETGSFYSIIFACYYLFSVALDIYEEIYSNACMCAQVNANFLLIMLSATPFHTEPMMCSIVAVIICYVFLLLICMCVREMFRVLNKLLILLLIIICTIRIYSTPILI